jgi:hypothetical protein
MFEFLGFLFLVGAVLTLGPMVFQLALALVFGVCALIVVGVQALLGKKAS